MERRAFGVGALRLMGLAFLPLGWNEIQEAKVPANVPTKAEFDALSSKVAAMDTRLKAVEAKLAQAPAPTPSPTPAPTPSPTPAPAPTPTPTPAATFTIVGNTIRDPQGVRFIVKGMTPIYGPFAGGDADGQWSTYSLNNSAAIMADLKANWGANLVRIFTSGGAALGHQPDWATADYRNRLWGVVAGARAQGLVVLLVNSYSNIADSSAWIAELALRYKNDPYVWITPSNEPVQTSPDATEKAHGSEWPYWQTMTQAQVNLIRAQGNHNPILINAHEWSWDWIGAPAISDPDNRLIYGAHRYANGNSWSSTEVNSCNASWANLAATKAVVADEIGNYNGSANGTVSWYQGMTDFLANWVLTRNGAGAIAFAHYWSDGNSQTTNGSTPNPWGLYWRDRFLALAR